MMEHFVQQLQEEATAVRAKYQMNYKDWKQRVRVKLGHLGNANQTVGWVTYFHHTFVLTQLISY